MSNHVKIQISPMYLHKAQNPRACHIFVIDRLCLSGRVDCFPFQISNLIFDVGIFSYTCTTNIQYPVNCENDQSSIKLPF